jgi:hypothetical protein
MTRQVPHHIGIGIDMRKVFQVVRFEHSEEESGCFDLWHYSPLNSGLRFSRNARMPSR